MATLRKIIILTILLIGSLAHAQTYTVERVIDGNECTELGGEIINTLSQADCGSNEYLGEVEGLKCPCICCKKIEAVVSSSFYFVERVIDGDTIKLTNGERVRLIGIDTPESKPNAKAMQDSMRTGKDLKAIYKMGQEATEFVSEYFNKDKEVLLQFDVQERDKYGRLLAYVYIPVAHIDFLREFKFADENFQSVFKRDGEDWGYIMLNAAIIQNGYATPMTIPPNVKHADLFKKLYKEARERKRGLWR